MTNLKSKALATVAAVLAVGAVTIPASAQSNPVTLGTPEYAGTGCPIGTVAAVVSPDGGALSILYNQYVAEVGSSVGRSIDRKNCSLAIPVHVPNGISVSILQVDYRGFNFLPAGARSTFNVEYFFAGSRGPTFNRTFTGPLTDEYYIPNTLVTSAVVWSRCGEDVILRTNNSLFLQTTGGRDALATVDSQDVNAAVVYHLQFRAC